MNRFVPFRSSSVQEVNEEPAEDRTVLAQDDILTTVQPEPWYKESLMVLIAGATTDLAQRKIYPALIELYRRKVLPVDTVIWGFAPVEQTRDELLDTTRPHLLLHNESTASEGAVDTFLKLCFYQAGQTFGDSSAFVSILQQANCHNLLVHLAMPPEFFGQTTHAIKMALNRTKIPGFTRLVLEKPFGTDTASCQSLLDTLKLQAWSEEEQLYRIDHYLGKEMVQNILTLRQRNPWLQAMWDKHTIQAVHIIYKESGTNVGGDIIRDVIQNHLLQILTLVALQLPDQMTAVEIHNAKMDILKTIPILRLEDCLLGQYKGFQLEESTTTTSCTPTYACIRTLVRTGVWDGVPFILEAGKALDEPLCEVRLHLKGDQHNALVLRLEPRPALFLTTNLKTPGLTQAPCSTHMSVHYGAAATRISTNARTRLLLDVLRGQKASFVRDDELLQAWHLFTPVLHEIESNSVPPVLYEQGTSGPGNRSEFLHAKNVRQEWLPLPSAL